MEKSRLIRIASLMAATTLGAGLFSLPFVFFNSGWLVSTFYLFVLGVFLAFAHNLYFHALEREGGRDLLGITEKFYGGKGKAFGSLIIIGGLLMSLVAYLVLADQLSHFIWNDPWIIGLLIFWLIGSIAIVLDLKELVSSELLGSVAMLGVILFVFGNGLYYGKFSFPAIDPTNLFLPFGPILFALAGWTAVEPIFDFGKKKGHAGALSRRWMSFGTFAAVILYAMFALGMIGSGSTISNDTISGLSAWPFWKFVLILILGLLAIWTSYVPIGFEFKRSMEKDFRIPKMISAALIFVLPLLLFFLGLKDFIKVIGFAGGVFLGLEYILILSVSKRALNLHGWRKFFVDLLIIIFFLGAVYEAYYFFAK